MVNNSRWLLTSVYGPNDSHRRKELWRELDTIRGRWNGAWCLGGDWHIIRFSSEKEHDILFGLDRFTFLGGSSVERSLFYMVESPRPSNYVKVE